MRGTRRLLGIGREESRDKRNNMEYIKEEGYMMKMGVQGINVNQEIRSHRKEEEPGGEKTSS
jgi:hypothetical protein